MKCSNCSFDIPDASEVCPYCQMVAPKPAPQNAAKREAAPAAAEAAPPAAPPRRSPLPVLLLTAAAAAVGAYFQLRPGTAPVVAPLKAARAVSAQVPEPVAAPAPAPPTPAAPAPPPPPPPPAPPRAVEHWEFSGRAYDILTLAPVYGAELRFVSGDSSVETSTDEKGRYRARLPALPKGSYRLEVSRPDYESRYLDEISPSYRTVDLATRRLLRKGKPRNEPWRGTPGSPSRRDIALIPGRSR